jgi:2-oxoglutarate ferredoxin oxidoreductase subunit beta
MQETFLKAAQHQGTSIVEVLQNCVIFNDKVHDNITNRKTRAENTINLSHGKPFLFGENQSKALVLEGFKPKVVNVKDVDISDLWIHDETDPNPTAAFILSQLELPDFPVPLGVFRAAPENSYDAIMDAQVDAVTQKLGVGDMNKLLLSGETWEVHQS